MLGFISFKNYSRQTFFLFVVDDGKLSFEEFKAYFSDGILTTEELQELFYSIDGRQTKCVLPEVYPSFLNLYYTCDLCGSP